MSREASQPGEDPLSFDAFESYYRDAKRETDERIDAILEEKHPDETELRKLLSHAVAGGKRLRPVLTLLVADAVGCPRDRALDHAALVELVHNTALVADDYADEDEMRRNMPAAYRVIERLPWIGPSELNPKTLFILYENGLLSIALDLVRDPGVARALSEGVRSTFRGFYHEGKDMARGGYKGGYNRWIEINKLKTGGLFALGPMCVATVAPVDDQVEEAARLYGQSIGLLYQTADDICDGDLPDFVTDPTAELEKWHRETVHRIPVLTNDTEFIPLLQDAPAYMTYRMLDQEGMLGAVDPAFLDGVR